MTDCDAYCFMVHIRKHRLRWRSMYLRMQREGFDTVSPGRKAGGRVGGYNQPVRSL